MRLFIVEEHFCDKMPPEYRIYKWSTGKWQVNNGKIEIYDIKNCMFCGCKLN